MSQPTRAILPPPHRRGDVRFHTLSRRSFLGVTGSAALAAFGGPAACLPERLSGAEWQEAFFLEIVRVKAQLVMFRARILVDLLRRRKSHDWMLDAGYDPPVTETLQAFRSTCTLLWNALPRTADPLCMPPFDVAGALEPVRCRLLHRNLITLEDEESIRVRDCVRVSGDRMIWSCTPAYPLWCREPLGRPIDVEQSARELCGWLGLDPCTADPTHSIRTARGSALVEAFRRMPLETFWALSVELFLIRPEAPAAVFDVVHTDSERGCWPLYFYKSICSLNLVVLMGHLANNHFVHVAKLSRLRQMHGPWLVFGPALILDVLAQKVLVMRHLARRLGVAEKVVELSSPAR
ncbi:MAG: hypothetical protein KY476_17720 [Planctomycetes bacterium]|nr:hypothetical protein [Planctomycetota bacterium]